MPCCAEPLVQAMKQIGRSCVVSQQPAAGVARKLFREGTKKTVRPIAKQKVDFRMGSRQAIQDCARVHADAGQIAAQAIGCV